MPLRPELVVEVAYDHMEGTRFRHTAQWRAVAPGPGARVLHVRAARAPRTLRPGRHPRPPLTSSDADARPPCTASCCSARPPCADHDAARIAQLHGIDDVEVHLLVPADAEHNRLIEALDEVALGRLARRPRRRRPDAAGGRAGRDARGQRVAGQAGRSRADRARAR